MADVIWSSRAPNDLDDIAASIRSFDPAAAVRTGYRLEALGDGLGAFPDRGREAARGARDMVIVRPYGLCYTVIRDAVLILRVRRGARRARTRR